MTFKEMVERDRTGVFLNLDELGEWETVEGKRIRIMPDQDRLVERQGNDPGLAEADLLLFARIEDLPERQEHLKVGKCECLVISWMENLGMAEIVLKQNRMRG